MTSTSCTPLCWQRADCVACGREIPPAGRDVAAAAANGYCSCAQTLAANRRHLWDEHDSARQIFDDEGWMAHVAGCSRCAGES